VLGENARELRAQGKTQEETAAIVGVPRQTLSDWESCQKEEDTSNAEIGITCIPDCRMKIPQTEHERIYDRTQKGKTQEETAAAVGVARKTVDLWESDDADDGDTSNTYFGITCIPDCRMKIPQTEHERIYDRAQNEESQSRPTQMTGTQALLFLVMLVSPTAA
jgi:transcriptional regulator with XRE-family HTH domain